MEYCGSKGERRLCSKCSQNHSCCIIGNKNPKALQECIIPAAPCVGATSKMIFTYDSDFSKIFKQL